MKSLFVGWDQFKTIVSENIIEGRGPLLFRGQSNSNWVLETSFHRNSNGITFEEYFGMMERLADQVGTIEKRTIEISTGEGLASFLAHLQHNGYPTPILDFSLSPYIAAFFAFSEYSMKTDFVSIYMFDYLKWLSHYSQVYDYETNDPHVSVLNPKLNGNMKQYNQFGFYYLFTNLKDIEGHFDAHENETKQYLVKFNLPIKDRLYAVLDMENMGITRHSLFGTTESWCAMMNEIFFLRSNGGKGALEHLKKINELNLLSSPRLRTEIESDKG